MARGSWAAAASVKRWRRRSGAVDASGQPRRVIFHLADATVPACLRTARVAFAGRPADVHLPGKSSEGLSRGHLRAALARRLTCSLLRAAAPAGRVPVLTYLVFSSHRSAPDSTRSLLFLALASPSASSPLHAVDHQPTQPRKTSVTAPRARGPHLSGRPLCETSSSLSRSDIPNREQGAHGRTWG